MQRILRLYRFLNVLSFDVAAGAVICAVFFAEVFDVSIHRYGLISLGLTVWIIYTADHLLDARKLHKPASTKRHRFHQRHFKLLLTLVFIAMLIDGVQLFYIKKPVFVGGIVVSCIVVVYFFVQRQLKFLKEIMGAVLYTSGVLLIPVSLKNNSFTTSQIIFISQFFLTALSNLLLFSWFDYGADKNDSHRSFTVSFGERFTQKSIIFFMSVNAVLALAQIVMAFPLYAELIVVCMNLVLYAIFFRKTYFEKNDRFRLIGDAIFLIPLFFILF